MNMEVLEQRIKELEKNQERFVLREVYEIFVDDFKDLKRLVHQNRNTHLKLIGALVAFKVIYAPLVVFIVKEWMAGGGS